MIDKLKAAAGEAMDKAYAPYSGFRVGAAVETDSGDVFSGCNVENASYGLTICAERSAVVSAVAAGHRRFRRIVIVSEGGDVVAPCGACRQVLAEFGDGWDVFGVSEKQTVRWTVGELLPEPFVLSNEERGSS